MRPASAQYPHGLCRIEGAPCTPKKSAPRGTRIGARGTGGVEEEQTEKKGERGSEDPEDLEADDHGDRHAAGPEDEAFHEGSPVL